MTIELGEVPPAGFAPDDSVEPSFDRRLLRKMGLVAVTALCVLTVTGSQRPEPQGVRLLWSIPVADTDGTTITDDTVYVTQAADDGRITAYDLATGAARWSRPTGSRSGYLQEAPGTGLLLMPGGTRSVPVETGAGELPGVNEFVTSTIAVEAGTGATRWTVPGDVQAIGAGSVLLSDYTDQGAIDRFRLVRLSDHSTIWTRDFPDPQGFAISMVGERPDKVITVSGDGEIVVSRFADGTTLAAGRIPWVRPEPEDGVFNDLMPIGDHLLVNRSRSDTVGMTVYRLDTLAEVWRHESLGGYPFACGTAICLNQGNQIVAYDPGTGTARWQLAGGFSAWPPTADRVILESVQQDGRLRLADAHTGRLIGEPALGNTIWNTHPEREMLLLQPTTTPAGLTSITHWDLDTGKVRLLGAIPRLTEYRCQAVERYLTCTRGTSFEVTAVG
jgi:outer membrane protein assembly factor BamB